MENNNNNNGCLLTLSSVLICVGVVGVVIGLFILGVIFFFYTQAAASQITP